MIAVQQVSVLFGNFELFRDISFVVNPRDRIGLVGKNGAGKSTLLRMFVGQFQPTSGEVVVPSGIHIGYLPQEMNHRDTLSVRDEVKQAYAELISLEKELVFINEELVRREDHHSPDYERLIHRLSEATERMGILGQGSMDADIESALLGLGFEREDLDRPTKTFSGGWRMRIELAKLLLSRPEILLLDEPTNHLDIESIQWLEEFLTTYPGAALIISHDRKFLDSVTTRTIEISLGKIYDYAVSYSKFVELSRDRREHQQAAFQNQQKMIEDTEKFIERFRYKATKAVQVQSRIKMLGRIDRLEVEEEDTARINMRFPAAPRSGTIVVEAKDASKNYGSKQVLDRLNFVIERGEKIAFVGRNGEGKTTLSKMIIGETGYDGELKIGHQVKIGYFAQNTDELLDQESTVFDTIDRVAVGDIRTKIRDILAAFLFRGEDIDKKVKVLSGGEKSRLALARLLLEPYNLLVLDEPTNHLDMRSKDILKQALLKFEGTIIVVSHDREFLDGLVDKIFEFRNRNIRQHAGGIYDFLRKRKMESLNELGIRTNTPVPPTETSAVKKASPQPVAEATVQVSKKDYAAKKELDKRLRKIQGDIARSEERIARHEEILGEIKARLEQPDYSDPAFDIKDLYTTFEKRQRELETEMAYWEKLHQDYDQLQKQG
ncbi:MAG: ABC-F family ATP-binding cassette domain-containing protein [Bacteroidales bacterium]